MDNINNDTELICLDSGFNCIFIKNSLEKHFPQQNSQEKSLFI